MLRVLPFADAELLQLDLGCAAGDLDLGAVVQVVAGRALEPRHFAIFFCHDNTTNASVVSCPLSVAAPARGAPRDKSEQLTTDYGPLTLFQDLGHHAGADRLAAFADGEAE